jgi:hypothetical protein
VSTRTSSPSSLSQLAPKSTSAFSCPRQTTLLISPPVSDSKALAAPKAAISPDPEQNTFQSALLRLCLFAAKLQWPAIFNQAIESYCRIVDTQVIPIDEVELAYKRTANHVLPLREYIIDHISEKAGGDGHMNYLLTAMTYPELMSDLFRKLRFPASTTGNGNAEDRAINPYKKYHMREWNGWRR